MDIVNFDQRFHDQVVQLWKDVFAYGDRRNDPALVLQRILSTDHDALFLAVEEDRVLGSVIAGYDGHRGWIYSLAVFPEYRKTGIAGKLLAKAEERLKSAGCVKINLQILPENRKLVEFYSKFGFAVEERISMGKSLL